MCEGAIDWSADCTFTDHSDSGRCRLGRCFFSTASARLCNRIVRLLLWLDGPAVLRFAAVAGTDSPSLPAGPAVCPPEDFDSLVFVPHRARRDRPELRLPGRRRAAQRRAGRRWVGTVVAWGRALPGAWRDAAYKFGRTFSLPDLGANGNRGRWRGRSGRGGLCRDRTAQSSSAAAGSATTSKSRW